MHALADIIAIMNSRQMTIRRISERISKMLRETARKEAKSINQVALEALERGLGIADEQTEYHDLDDLSGTWIEDPEFDRVIAEIDAVDTELWK